MIASSRACIMRTLKDGLAGDGGDEEVMPEF
jgi:hypothetical protein